MPQQGEMQAVFKDGREEYLAQHPDAPVEEAEAAGLRAVAVHLGAEAEALRMQVAALAAELEGQTTWRDAPGPEDEAIAAEFPTRSKNYERFTRALELVSRKHGKYELVGLVNWLLARAERAEAALGASTLLNSMQGSAPHACGTERPLDSLPAELREELGREVRAEWVQWAKQQPNPKHSWLAPWEEMSEADKEVDRRIGERLYRRGRAANPAELRAAAKGVPMPREGKRREHHLTLHAEEVRALLQGTSGQVRVPLSPPPPALSAVKALAGLGYTLVPHGKAGAGATYVAVGPVWALRRLMRRKPEWRCPYAEGDVLLVPHPEGGAGHLALVVEYTYVGLADDLPHWVVGVRPLAAPST